MLEGGIPKWKPMLHKINTVQKPPLPESPSEIDTSTNAVTPQLTLLLPDSNRKSSNILIPTLEPVSV
jgi:hypothetical protein